MIYKTCLKSEKRARTEVVLVEDPGTGETIDLTQREDEALWSRAIIETLRRTGIRREELSERVLVVAHIRREPRWQERPLGISVDPIGGEVRGSSGG